MYGSILSDVDVCVHIVSFPIPMRKLVVHLSFSQRQNKKTKILPALCHTKPRNLIQSWMHSSLNKKNLLHTLS